MSLFGVPKKRNNKYVFYKNGRARYNYEALYEEFKKREYMTPLEIKELTGVNSVQEIITTMSLLYPIYEAGYGKYALLKL